MTKRKDREALAANIKREEKARPVVTFEALNIKQVAYIKDLQHCPCTLVRGSAGTGKTYLAASVAAQCLANRSIGTIVISRPNVPTGKSLGAFPGTVEEKMAPWLLSITDTLKQQLGAKLYENEVKLGHIQVQPIETIRGRSFDNAMLLFDESQQLTRDEVKAIVTRIGKYSRLVLMGDPAQRDNNADGLEYLIGLSNRHNLPVAVHTFDSDDIVRSDICKLFVKAFEKDE